MSPDPNSQSSSGGSTDENPAGIAPVPVPRETIDTKTIIGGEAVTGGDSSNEASQIGETIGKYQIRSQLGVGGMGAVYLAFDPLIEREVAIKVLSENVAASNVALQRFLQEARSIGRLNHPNVVSIYDIDQYNGQYYIVMELLSGGSLAELIDKSGPVPWREACRMIAQAAMGLEAAHAAEMVHRDIKPENLMQTKDGFVKVVDFGLSKLVDAANDTRSAVTKQGQILGTPQYMSPEQFESTEVDLRTDIYSLGASLFRLATARFPYHDCATIVQTMMAHLNKPAPKATEFDSAIPEGFDQIIAKAMAKRAEDRYQNAHRLADDLIALIQDHDGNHASTLLEELQLETTANLSSDTALDLGQDQSTVNNKNSRMSEAASDLTNSEKIQDIVPLKSVLIVEPSRMMAAMMKDAVVRAGASLVAVVSSKLQAMAAIQDSVPDILVTAMQLPDGLGNELVGDISLQSSLHNTCLVVNSSDSAMDELNGAASVASRVLAPKRVRPDDVLRVVHAIGPVVISKSPIAMPLDPMNLRLVVMTDFEKAPPALAELIREVGLLDVAVIGTVDTALIPKDDVPTVVLRLKNRPDSVAETPSGEKFADFLPDARHLLADIEVDFQTLLLRSICRQGVIAATSRILDANRLSCLLQACRSS